MPGRPLKNYDNYHEKILAYLEACGLTLEYREVDGDGMYSPSRRKITVSPDLPESTEIATLLHEAGHSLDDTLYNKRTMKVHDKAYNAYYDGTATRVQCELVIEAEKRAWLYGRSVAKQLKIPLGKWYQAEQDDALNGYIEESTQ